MAEKTTMTLNLSTSMAALLAGALLARWLSRRPDRRRPGN